MSEAPRCGKRVDVIMQRRQPEFSEENWEQTDDGRQRCIRDSFDTDGDGRCIWHTEDDVRPSQLSGILSAEERIDEANFDGMNLSRVQELSFTACGLAGASFIRTNLDEVDFSGTDTTDTVLRGARFTIGKINGAVFDRVQLNGAHFRAVQADESTLLNVKFNDSTLTDTDFDGLRLVDCEFRETNFAGTTFRDTTHHGSDLDGAVVSGAEFVGGTLSGVDFSAIREFEDAQFSAITIKACSFDQLSARQDRISFSDTALLCCSFQEAEFRGADFSESVVVNSTFRGALLKNADFSNATLAFVEVGGKHSVVDISFKEAHLLAFSITVTQDGEFDLISTKRSAPAAIRPNRTEQPASFREWVDTLEDDLVRNLDKIQPRTQVKHLARIVQPENATRGEAGNVASKNLPLQRLEELSEPLYSLPTITLTPMENPVELTNVEVTNATLCHSCIENINFDEPTLSRVDLTGARLNSVAFRNGDLSRVNLSDVEAQDIEIPGTVFDDISINDNTILGTRRSQRILPWGSSSNVYLRPELEAMEADGSGRRPFGVLGILWHHWQETTDLEMAKNKYQQAGQQYKTLELLFAANNDARSTSNYFYRSQDTKHKLHRISGKYRIASIEWLQRFIYGYGVRPKIVSRSILLVWLLFGIAFMYIPLDGAQHTDIDFGLTPISNTGLLVERLYYSVTTLTSVGLGDLTPAGFAGRLLTGAEGIIGMTLVVLLGYVLGNRESW